MSDAEIPVDDEGLVRLQKLLAMSGVASRRKCEELMLEGERQTFPRVEMIRICSKISRTLEGILRRADIGGLAGL